MERGVRLNIKLLNFQPVACIILVDFLFAILQTLTSAGAGTGKNGVSFDGLPLQVTKSQQIKMVLHS